MADCEDQIFVDTDVDVLLNPKTGWTLADMSDLVITLTHSKAAQSPVVYSLTGGGVVVNQDLIYLLVLKGDITEPGCYEIKARLLDNTVPTPKERGLSSCVLPDETTVLRFVT